jgi:hypothetical protein
MTAVSAGVGDIVIAPHIPSRPDWQCKSCGEAWPCVPAKGLMLIEFAGCELTLMEYLATQCVAAIDDFRGGTHQVPKDLFGRFLGWAKM